MRIVKKILILAAFIIAIPLIIALFVKKEYSIQREITINKPQQEVFDYVKYLKNQDNYSKWVMTDPAMKKDFRGTDGTEGFVYAWDSKNKNAGKGEQEITKITEGKRLDIEVRFEKPMEGIAATPIETEAVSENETKVKWGMNGKNKYPMNLMNLFMDNMLGSDLETSLTNLKGILEKK
ncbi:MAG: SRPBCC family protein [Chitinophagaceae bacterium]